MVKNNFPNVTEELFEAYVQPNTGHGINAHYNATGAYAVITDFLSRQGLEGSELEARKLGKRFGKEFGNGWPYLDLERANNAEIKREIDVC